MPAALVLVALAPPAPAQVSFSGSNNFFAGPTPESVVVGDFNADSRPDLAVANIGSNDISVRLNHTATAGDDPLTGNAENNVICGLGGSDAIRGRGGDDTLFGGQCDTAARLPRSSGAAAGDDGNDSLDGGRGERQALRVPRR